MFPSQRSSSPSYVAYYIIAAVLGALLLAVCVAIILALFVRSNRRKRDNIELVEAVKVVQIREDDVK